VPDSESLPRSRVLLFAVACGLAVANVYYAHPLLDAIADSFGVAPASIGVVVTVTQIGYGVGLLLLVPLGDVLDRRRLIVTQLLVSVAALAVVGAAR
jgi:predicted MFS family arabinose efflux permease